MSQFSQKDTDRRNEEQMLWNRIWESFRMLTGKPEQRAIDRFNENQENAKKEREFEHKLHHQGDEEEGELMRLPDDHDPLGEGE